MSHFHSGWLLLSIVISLLQTKASDQAEETEDPNIRHEKKLPHILFIVADDFGWNDVGYHQNKKSSGNPEGKATTNAEAGLWETPVIDGLAAAGVKLENYYVQQLCSPTRTTIMTGRYASHTGIGPNVDRIDYPYGVPAEETFFPQLLRERAGYSTHMVGKWHMGACHRGYHPTYRGFDSYVGYLAGGQGYYRQSGDRNSTCSNKLGPCLGDAYAYNYSSIFFANECKRIIADHAREETSGSDRPLFLYLAFQSVHNPYQVPPIDVNRTFPSIYNYDRRIYAGMVKMMDDAIGEVVDALKAAGNMWDDTVVIFTSDNGGIGLGNNYPLRGTKAYNWEGGIKAVGFVRGTNNRNVAPLPSGATCNALMHSTDWFLTIVEGLAGPGADSNREDAPALTALPLDGYNQWNVLAGVEQRNPRTSIYHQVPVGAYPIKTGDVDDKGMPIYTTNLCMHFVDNRTATKWCSAHGVTGGAYREGDYKLLITHDGDDAPWFDTSSPNNAHQYLPGGQYPNGTQIFVPPSADTKPDPFEGKYYLFNIARDPTESYNLASEMPSKLRSMLRTYQRYATTSAKPSLDWKWGFTDPNWRNNPDISNEMRTGSSDDSGGASTSSSRLLHEYASSAMEGEERIDVSGDNTCTGPFLESEYCSYGNEWSCFVKRNDLEGFDVSEQDNVKDGPTGCQARCAAFEGCNYWVFFPSLNQKCKLKSARGKLVPCSDCVFGPKECPT